MTDETQLDYTSLETLLAEAAKSTKYELYPRIDFTVAKVRELWEAALEALLPKVAKSASYEPPPRIDFTVAEVREFWEAIEQQGNFVTLQSLPVVDPETLAQIEFWIETALQDYMSDGYYGVGALSLVSKPYFSSAKDVSLALVRAATLIGISRVIEHLQNWLNYVPLTFTTKSLIFGLHLEAPLNVSKDIMLRPIGLSPREFGPDLPAFVKNRFGSLERLSLIDTVMISINQEMWHMDTLFTPESDELEEKIEEEFLLEERDQLDAVYRALSLATDSAVIPLFKWRDYGDLPVFNTGTLDPGMIPSAESSERDLMLGERASVSSTQIAHAAKLFPGLNAGNLTSLGLYQAAERWTKAKRLGLSLPELTMADSFIELRIVLEALFLKDAKEDRRTHKISKRAALVYGKNHQEVKEIEQKVRTIYVVGSEAVHAGELSTDHSNRELLSFGLSLAREEILKRLDAGRLRDWDTITLG